MVLATSSIGSPSRLREGDERHLGAGGALDGRAVLLQRVPLAASITRAKSLT